MPTFIVIGAMKSGTDSLYRYLAAHPSVFMSAKKELDFFVEEMNWRKGRAWYERQFAEAGSAVAIGEASTSYTKFPRYRGVPERMSAMLPDVRLVYVVRQPIDRMRSQYLHQVLHGEEHDPVEVALLRDPSYLDFSRYAMQIDRYLEHVPPERLLVVVSDDLRERRRETLARVLTFIGVEGVPSDEALEREYHRTEDKRVLRPALRTLHRVPGYRAVAALVPGRLKTVTYRARTRGVDPARSRIGESLRARLEDELREDVARLHAFVGDGFDGWGLLAARPAERRP